MHEAMAIGDDLNDLHLIKAAGLSITTANGARQLKQAADAVTASNGDIWVAKAIQHYVLGVDSRRGVR